MVGLIGRQGLITLYHLQKELQGGSIIKVNASNRTRARTSRQVFIEKASSCRFVNLRRRVTDASRPARKVRHAAQVNVPGLWRVPSFFEVCLISGCERFQHTLVQPHP